MTRYWLLFMDSKEPHLRRFKPGFRHMWIVAEKDGRWVTIDPLACSFEIEIWDYSASPVGAFEFWDHMGYTYIEVTPGKILKMPFFTGLLTCVGVAKRFLGLNKPFIQTPWQLYRYLVKDYIDLTSKREHK